MKRHQLILTSLRYDGILRRVVLYILPAILLAVGFVILTTSLAGRMEIEDHILQDMQSRTQRAAMALSGRFHNLDIEGDGAAIDTILGGQELSDMVQTASGTEAYALLLQPGRSLVSGRISQEALKNGAAAEAWFYADALASGEWLTATAPVPGYSDLTLVAAERKSFAFSASNVLSSALWRVGGISLAAVVLAGLAASLPLLMPLHRLIHDVSEMGEDGAMQLRSVGPIETRILARTIEESTRALARENERRRASEKRLEKSLKRSEVLAAAMQGTSLAVTLIDPAREEHPVIYSNRAFSSLCSLPKRKITGRNWREVMGGDMPESDLENLASGMEEGVERVIEYCIDHPNKNPVWVEANLVPIRSGGGVIKYFCTLHRDITIRKMAEMEKLSIERELSQSQKLEALGNLAGGIAHEINTPAQYVGDNIRFLRDAFSDIATALLNFDGLDARDAQDVLIEAFEDLRDTLSDDDDGSFLKIEVPDAIRQALEGIERISEIVRAIKEFSHPDQKEKAPVDINRALETTATVTRNTWKYVAEIETDLEEDLPYVDGLAGELNQVFLNLITNAADAIGDKVESGQMGTIGLRTCRAGEHIEIHIRDDGAGISKEHMDRIFEPFFTTKEVGKGSGQGLAICHTIICQRHGGQLTVASHEGEGTCFTIRLPIAKGFGDFEEDVESEIFAAE